MADINYRCICGHYESSHSHKVFGFKASECRIMLFDHTHCNCMKFKLDNLALVERLARDKGLV